MAGIGFELKKLFSNKGLIQKLRANLYASIVITGPMVLGFLLLVGVKYLSKISGATEHQQDLIIVVITYSLLFSLLLTSILSYVLTRFIADMLHEDQRERILPSMYGAISLQLIVGAVGWGIFLYYSQLPFEYSILSFILYCEAVVIWTQINYTSALKDYRGILISFGIGITISLLAGYLLTFILVDVVAAMLIGPCVGYGIMMIGYTILLHRYFPRGEGSSLKFIEWLDKFPALTLVGFFSTLGLFIHLMVMWASPWGIQVHGLFYHAPRHDIPAMMAFFTILPTTVNFVTSFEVNFYARYRLYYSLLNEGGTLGDITKVYDEMIAVLKQELFYLAQRQVIVTVIAIVVIAEIIDSVGVNFTAVMIGLFRVLCVGYGLYAIGNSIVILQMYFVNYKAAVLSAFILLFVNGFGTFYTITLSENYYGFGLLAAGISIYIFAWLNFSLFARKLEHHIFSRQPLFVVENSGILTRLARKFN